MQILSLQYSNIGPFRDQSVEIFPQAGNYSIQAPIGSGKSFLFFDGPLFALYKKSQRLMLNNLSEAGEVVIEFIEAGQQYCVSRRLKKTKTGETVQSQLRSQAPKPRTLQSEIFQFGELKKFDLDPGYEKIDLKNESDIQALLDSILPSQEVFLATYFLMQDSQNIFEAAPKDRLEVFKHVFGLLGIDELKDTIAEKRRELNTIIKVRGDETAFEEEFAILHHELLMSWNDISQYSELLIGDGRSQWQTFVAEQKLLANTLLIEHFRMPDSPDYEQAFDSLQIQTEQFYAKQTDLEVYKTRHQHTQDELAKSEQSLQILLGRIRSLESSVQNSNDTLLQSKEKELQILQGELDRLWVEDDKRRVHNLIKGTVVNAQLSGDSQLWRDGKIAIDDVNFGQSEWTLTEVSRLIDRLIVMGKEKKAERDYNEEKEKDYQTRLTKIEEKLKQGNPDLEKYLQFAGEKSVKIETLLNTFDRRQDVMHEVEELVEQSQTLAGSFDKQLVEELKTLQAEYKRFVKSSQQEKLQAERKILGELLQKLDWKVLQARAQQEFELQRKLTRQTQDLSNLRQVQEAQIKQRTQLEELRGQEKILEKEITTLKIAVQESEQAYQKFQSTLGKTIGLEELKRQKSEFERFQIAEQSLQALLVKYKDNALHIQQIKAKEKKLGDLYTLFSKELLLLVVQNNLPKIERLMNAYLSQVVDYELRMSVDKKSLTSENLELKVMAVDEYGEREVKSLSGGQKVILKLVWMIAVSFVVDAPMLFLDETINNLDDETVSKVATILTSFVESKGKEFQFYVVSHDEQIQNLSIWDDTFFIKNR